MAPIDDTRAVAKAAPKLFTIPAGVAFVDALARGLITQYGDDLADLTIYLPTRRGIRSLREAFLRQSQGAALLLPRMRPLGDIDDDDAEMFADSESLSLAPAIPALRRRLLLASLIQRASADAGRMDLGWAQATELARDLCRLLDQLHMQDKDLTDLEDLVAVEFAEHWRKVLRFLDILAAPWQQLLAAEGYMEPVPRRNQAVRLLLDQWRNSPPAKPIIAAGSTGSIKATATLLAAIARLPQGAVVLPGLDQILDGPSWEQVGETHPQHAMKMLLQDIGIERRAVALWPAAEALDHATGPARRHLTSQTLRPAESSQLWRQMPALAPETTAGLDLLRAAGPREEAIAIALAMRKALEQPGKSAALVTPDRPLARRVAGELQRWGVAVDDSAGQPLSLSPVGALLRLLVAAVDRQLAPVALLALLKHPLCRLGRAPAEINGLARRLDREVLRGARPAPGFAGLHAALDDYRRRGQRQRSLAAPLAEFLNDLEAVLGPMASLWRQDDAGIGQLLAAHVQAAERLAGDEHGGQLLWRGEDGEVAAQFVHELLGASAGLPAIRPNAYPTLLDVLLADQVVRPRYGRHPRLAIWGPLEARLQQADLLILAGLNEGTWPGLAPADPWINRPMQKHLGLATPEQRIGLAAHDFAQALAGPNVLLSRAEKADGTPTVPARWLLRLEQVLNAAGLALPLARGRTLNHWVEALDQPAAYAPWPPPRPTPPAAARCAKLSVTAVETWLRDPYALYAGRILGLRALDEIDADPSAADRGSAIHLALEKYLNGHGDFPAAGGLEALLAAGEEVFAGLLSRPAVRAFWWPRFCRLAVWFLARQSENQGRTLALEISGTLGFDYPGGHFELTATADRIDQRADGALAIIDYKTGAVPTSAQVLGGLAPQLTLEAAIAEAGGFAGIAAGPVAELQYWRLSGGREAGEIKSLADQVPDLAAASWAGLQRLVTAFGDPAVPYRARPRPEVALTYNDYEHLARIKEWALGGGEDP